MFVEAKFISTKARMFSLLNGGGTLCLLKEAKILSTKARMFSLLNGGGTLCLLKLNLSLPRLACFRCLMEAALCVC